MESKVIVKSIGIILLLVLSFGQLKAQDTLSQQDSQKENLPNTELKLTYPGRILNRNFDFNLAKAGSGKFLLTFYNNQPKGITIKIYDILGNLIIQEQVKKEGLFSKEYDLSFYNAYFFVVEVGNSKYNKTKSIIAR